MDQMPKTRAVHGIFEMHGWLVALEAGAVVRGAARKEAWRALRAFVGALELKARECATCRGCSENCCGRWLIVRYCFSPEVDTRRSLAMLRLQAALLAFAASVKLSASQSVWRRGALN